ncbi:MAG: tyrosine-type recombinase/integrase [Actinomycetota bacterium]|nr:tyrosine-type recombinase/integrase [Actinomycetota bacterium]
MPVRKANRLELDKKSIEEYIGEFLSYLSVERNASPRTIHSYGQDLKEARAFLASLGIGDIEEVTVPSLRELLKTLKERGLGPVSISRKISTLRSFFNFLELSDFIRYNPARRLVLPKKPKRVPVYLTKEEVERLVWAAKRAKCNFMGERERNVAMIKLLAYAGLRKSELLSLDWDDVNFTRKTLLVRKGKGNKERVVPLHPVLVEDLWEYLQTRFPLKCKALLIGRDKGRYHENMFRYDFKKIVRLAALDKRVTPHILRHSFASLLLKSGANIVAIQEILGHADITSTRIYLHMDMGQLHESVERLDLG